MGGVFFDLTIIIVAAAVLAVIFRFFKQPPILAYILTGVIVGPLGLFGVTDHTEVWNSFAEIGIALLLFMLGLELRISELKSVGKTALLTGISQIFFTTGIGFLISLLLGFSPITATYMAIAMTFSSTIIVVKLLSDKKDLKSLYGKITIGFLLVQDFVAIIALIILSGLSSATHALQPMDFLILALKTIVLFGWMIVVSKTLLPRIMRIASKSSELLFLFSLAWAFGMAALVSSPVIGFSIEIGGFLAGIALANSVSHVQIVSKIRPLRDFFITIFFVTLGMKMVFANLDAVLIPSIIYSIFILIGNPLIVVIILGLLGYRRRTSFLAGLTVAQISEFSMILIFLGNKIGHVPDHVMGVVTMVGAITFVVSTYMILNGNKLYQILFPILGFFERSSAKEKRIASGDLKNHVVLIGANRMGESILDALIAKEYVVQVVDFDPDVITRLDARNIRALYGDIADPEIQEQVNLDKAEMVISTVPDVEDNSILLKKLQKENKKAQTILFALEPFEAEELYKLGADYVILPTLAGGRHLAKLIAEKKMGDFKSLRSKDLRYIS
jgi:Kef-type K+ transport system membrane component KefB/voltage-gated potassium channel Kch